MGCLGLPDQRGWPGMLDSSQEEEVAQIQGKGTKAATETGSACLLRKTRVRDGRRQLRRGLEEGGRPVLEQGRLDANDRP